LKHLEYVFKHAPVELQLQALCHVAVKATKIFT